MKQETAKGLKVGDAFQCLSSWGKQPKPVWWVMSVHAESVLAKAYVRCVHEKWVRTTRVFVMKSLVERYTKVDRGLVPEALQVAEQINETVQQT